MKHKSFKEYSKETSFKYSLVTVFLIVCIIFMVAFLLLIYIEKNNAKEASIKLEDTINESFEKIYEKIEAIGQEKEYLDYFQNKEGKEKAYYDFYQFRKNLNINLDLIIEENDNIILSTKSNREDKLIDDLRSWEEFVDKNNNKLIIKQNTEKYDISIFLEKELELKGNLYRIIFDIDENSLNRILNEQTTTINFLMGSFGEILSTNHSSIVGAVNKFNGVEKSKDVMTVNNKDYFYSWKELSFANISLVSLYEVSNFKNYLVFLMATVLLLVVILLIVINITWNIISEKNNEALNTMILAIQENKKGDLDYKVDEPIFEEFQSLYSEYNNMMVSIEELVRKNQQISYLNKVDYLKLLNAQFNPHFLFNTLESLRFLIKFDPDKASDYIVDLSKILRSTIDNKGFYTKVEDEIGYIKSYLRLQKMRYDERLNYSIDVDENVLNNDIPKFIIQPIIENSIKYTYKKQDYLELKIRIEDLGDSIKIIIRDNGPGIDEDIIKDLKNNLSNYTSQMGIGFYNVNKKLELLYENYYFDFNNWDNGLLIEIIVEKEKYV